MATQNAEVIKGAEPFFLKGSDVGILLCHGFMGTPQSVFELGELLHQWGYTVSAPRLTGHGTNIFDLEQSKHTDWKQDIETSYLQLKQYCRDVFLIGQSMGGALTLQLAAQYQEIAGLITINAARHVPVYENYKGKTEPRFLDEGTPDVKNEQAVEITYNQAPIASVQELFKLIEQTDARLTNVRCPILVLASKEDHVVPPSDSDYIFANVSSTIREHVILYDSFHVASIDYDKEKIATLAAEFINKLVDK